MQILKRRHRTPLSLISATIALNLGWFFSTLSPVKAQTSLDLGSGDDFSLVFLVASPVGAAISHNPSTLIFNGSSATLTPVTPLLPSLTATTSQTRLNASHYNLNLQVTTNSTLGFIPADFTLGVQPINKWAVDLGNLFSDKDQGIAFRQPVIYNSAVGTWFDDGTQVFQASYLPTILNNSTPTELLGQFIIALPNGNDLGAFGHGIDTFSLSVNVTIVPESRSILGLLLVGFLIIISTPQSGLKR